MLQFPDWKTHPIPGVSLSAGGLLALADLSTVAQRTAITGGSTWLDSLLLAPGLHYQQAADELARRSAGTAHILSAVGEVRDGEPVTFTINNAATANYIQQIARPGETVVLDVGYRLRRSPSGLHATIWTVNDIPDLGWVSHVLYLISPILTITALVFVILLQDWWTLSSLLALMLSRLLNIFIIKQRTATVSPPPTSPDDTSGSSTPSPNHHHSHSPNHHRLGARLMEAIVSLGDGQSSAVKLRGTPEDLRAVTTDTWLRRKTAFEGYLEAAAKLIVFLVAAVSGNMTQAGAVTMMALLLTTAGLLGLSNQNAKAFRVNGRTATPFTGGSGEGIGGKKAVVVDGGRVLPAADGGTTTDGGADLAEKGMGQAGAEGM
ncbi:hypothetical protein QBC47DRAFT_150104 [Echria macrotheca]|uniref:Uncharacterized protein n=1 Tax=Echria macrotheca TaxID=438768 RepID=A0AAJ0BKV5_9PEZI|nr:hypothetical protein QBC47DRAFT_150104 [Echria macrotheca]